MNLELLIPKLIKTYPDFYNVIVKQAENWIYADGSIVITVLFGSLAELVKERIIAGEYEDLDKVFNLMEELITSQNRTWGDAAATGFLENLANITSDEIDSNQIIAMLGTKSQSHIQAYNKFNGIE